MRWRSRCVLAVALAGGVAPACANPSAPSRQFVTLTVAYTFVPPADPPVDSFDAGSCAHHNAPNHLRVHASWTDESVMFEQADSSRYLADLQVRRSGDYWITFADIRLCAVGGPVVPAAGVSVNDVRVTRTQLGDGRYVFRFSVDAAGAVRASSVTLARPPLALLASGTTHACSAMPWCDAPMNRSRRPGTTSHAIPRSTGLRQP